MLSGGAALTPRGGDAQELTLSELVSESQRTDALIPKRVLLAELYGRLARSLAIVFLPFLAFPLALAAKRGRRAPGMIVGAVILVAYHHGVTLCQSFAAKGQVDPGLAIGGLFVAIAAFGLWLFLSSRQAARRDADLHLPRRASRPCSPAESGRPRRWRARGRSAFRPISRG